MTPSRQIPLPFDHRPALDAADFLVAPSNADAVAWIDRWETWPGPVLGLCGPKASGKSHLAKVYLDKTQGRALTLLDQADPLAGINLVIDDADRRLVDQPGAEEALFHLINGAKETGAKLLLTGSTPPARWSIKLPDLASRLNAAPVAEIGAPDDTLLTQVITKQFMDRQLRVGPAVVQYLVTHMERSFEAAESLVDALDREALAKGQGITVPLARAVLQMNHD